MREYQTLGRPASCRRAPPAFHIYLTFPLHLSNRYFVLLYARLQKHAPDHLRNYLDYFLYPDSDRPFEQFRAAVPRPLRRSRGYFYFGLGLFVPYSIFFNQRLIARPRALYQMPVNELLSATGQERKALFEPFFPLTLAAGASRATTSMTCFSTHGCDAPLRLFVHCCKAAFT
jgi:hypothetical protein